MVYNEWWCTVCDGVQWGIITVSDDYSEWWCTVSDGVQWIMVYSAWSCTVSDGV